MTPMDDRTLIERAAKDDLPLGQLRPCPFCGSRAEFYPDGDMEGHTVMCSGDNAAADDPCPLNTFGFSSMTDAQAAWNRRAAASLAMGE